MDTKTNQGGLTMKMTNFFIGLDSNAWIVIDRNTNKRLFSSFKRTDCEKWVKEQIELWDEKPQEIA